MFWLPQWAEEENGMDDLKISWSEKEGSEKVRSHLLPCPSERDALPGPEREEESKKGESGLVSWWRARGVDVLTIAYTKPSCFDGAGAGAGWDS